ncbi:MAG: carboxylating nicotinate-nucleotide diphosphorylase [Candidatus Omnitrophota bacterium]
MRKAFSYPTKPSSPAFSQRHGAYGHPLPVSQRTLNFLKEALREDIGAGDITSNLLVPFHAKGTARVIAKEKGIFCGERLTMELFKIADPTVKLEFRVHNGHLFRRGQVIFKMHGNIRSILKVERTLLNFISHFSGIATRTRQFVEKVKKYPVLILHTRKTTPLWRELEKVAVEVGGGRRHRPSLDAYILVKENHRFYGGLAKLKRHPYDFEIEVRDLKELWEAIRLKPKVILLDNFTPKEARRAVEIIRKEAPGVIIEASGGITLENVRKYAATGVNTLSIGALTHSVEAVDFSLLID